MNMKRTTGLLLAALLAATTTTTATAGAAEGWQVAEGSYVLAVTGKAGLLGALGHEHAILGETVQGEICHDPTDPASTRAAFTVPTASLVIDSTRGRELADLGDGPKPDDVEKMQQDMLSARYLGADEHPEITLTLKELRAGRQGPLRVTADFSLHGVTREVSFPLEVSRDHGRLTATGGFTVEQTGHGIEPSSVAGVVKVADPVEVRFHLLTRATGEECHQP